MSFKEPENDLKYRKFCTKNRSFKAKKLLFKT